MLEETHKKTRLVMSIARAKYHWRVLKLATQEILLKDYILKQVDESDFGVKCAKTT